MAIRQMTGSASVISLLSGLGHCMSHSYVLSHETALAQLNMSNDSTVPPSFLFVPRRFLDALLLHAKRSSYQACIWKSALQPVLSTPLMTGFGWKINEGKVEVHWMTLPAAAAAAADSILENVNCGCKSDAACFTKRCACKKADLKCTGLCSCRQDCANRINEAVSEVASDEEQPCDDGEDDSNGLYSNIFDDY